MHFIKGISDIAQVIIILINVIESHETNSKSDGYICREQIYSILEINNRILEQTLFIYY